MTKTIPPIIKWTGTKRYVAKEIIAHFPKEINTLYEPFVGSGAITAQLLKSDIKINKVICSDLNPSLIGLWNLIKDNPSFLFNSYSKRWNELNALKGDKDQTDYYNSIKKQFNISKAPELFFFLLRTCYNGVVRFNRKGEFNVSYHFGRPGIHPTKLNKILTYWSKLIQKVEFKCQDYQKISPEIGDFVIVDPPYFNVTSSIYNGLINDKTFCGFLRSLKCGYALTLDGKNDKDDRTFDLPKDLYNNHVYMKMGKSSLRRLKGEDNLVYESLYLKL